MQKSHTKYHSRLINELSSLRKGRGIAPIKMYHKPILRERAAISLGVDDDKITNSQVYNFFLEKISRFPHTTPFIALRHALGLGEDVVADATLSQRRSALSKMWGKHPDTIVRYENQAIDDLVTYLETPDENSGPATTPRPVVLPDAYKKIGVQNNIMRDTVKLNLAGLLPLANRTSELLSYLEQSQRPYLEASVDIKFTSSNRGADWYRLRVKYVFMGKRDTFRLAIVMDGEDGEQLLVQGLIDDYQKINDTIDPRQEIRTMRNNSSFMAYNPALKSQKLFRFHELDPAHAQTLVRSTGEPLRAPFRVLEIKLPPKWQADGIVYEYHSTFNLRDDIHYAYWYAPSMMFVKKLSFDYSEFPQVDNYDFVIIPFLGNVTSNGTRKKHSYVVRPNSWIMPGNGMAAVWEAKDR